MELFEKTILSDDTIVAVATPPGHAALGMVRVSGPRTAAVLNKFCNRRSHSEERTGDFFTAHPRRTVLCDITDGRGESLDQGVVVYYHGPASYTGEDAAEITLHGNPHLLRKFVLILAAEPGVRPAEGGEFTRRAFRNGKLDLTQAEATRRLIEARSEYELQAGRKILQGEISRLVAEFREELIGLKAETEAEVDFSTEDLVFESRDALRNRVRLLLDRIDEILARAEETNRLAAGCQIAIAGIPNAGKSSLLNRLLGWDRAIVSARPGTTRDYLAEELQIEGLAVRFVDTAGIREAADELEEEGVRRSVEETGRSQIILHVVDGSLPAYEFPRLPSSGDVIHVINKADILHQNSWTPEGSAFEIAVSISCKTGAGLERLRQLIRDRLTGGRDFRDNLLLEDRQRAHFIRTGECLRRVFELWEKGAPAEITALELDDALDNIGRITGKITGEDILDRIFSTFCIGK